MAQFDAYDPLKNKNKKLFPILKLSIAYLLNAIYIARYSKYVHCDWEVPIDIYTWIDELVLTQRDNCQVHIYSELRSVSQDET
jgi:hypothetical protein